MRKHEKGFTLIELLVVIAIIGILAALVLVALGNARDKANDAAIKSDIGQLRTIAEIVYDNNSANYTAVATCFDTPNATNCGDDDTDDSITAIKTDIQEKDGDDNTSTSTFQVNSDADDFCISAQLRSDDYVCVDASGQTNESATATCGTAAVECPA